VRGIAFKNYSPLTTHNSPVAEALAAVQVSDTRDDEERGGAEKLKTKNS